jgi:hypothetical protein
LKLSLKLHRALFIIPSALNTALPSPLRVGIYSHLKREKAMLRPAGTGGSRRGEGLVEGIEVEEEGREGGERGKEKEEIPAIKRRCAEFGTLISGSGM